MIELVNRKVISILSNIIQGIIDIYQINIGQKVDREQSKSFYQVTCWAQSNTIRI